MSRPRDTARRRRLLRLRRCSQLRKHTRTTTLAQPETLEPRQVFAGDVDGASLATLQANDQSLPDVGLPHVLDPERFTPRRGLCSLCVPSEPIDRLPLPPEIFLLPTPSLPPLGGTGISVDQPPVTIVGGVVLEAPEPVTIRESPIFPYQPTPDLPDVTPPSSGFSSDTKTQIEGVDEADLVEVDGTTLYTLSQSGVLSIVDHSAPGSPAVLNQLKVTYEHEIVSGMFFNKGLLTIIRTSSLSIHSDGEVGPTTTITVLNVSNPEELTLLHDLQIDAAFVDSRMIDGKLLLVTQEKLLPSTQTTPITVSRITVHALDISTETVVPTDSVAFLSVGAFETFASADSLYVFSSQNDSTTIHKIAYDFADTKNPLDLVASDIVAGRFLNQFAADEHEGHLRLVLETSEGTAVVIFRQEGHELREVGRLDGLAAGENLHSVRFTENRAYIVTFETIDPLFVVDISDPTTPTVLGELKVPGFADHIELLGENHLLTIGYATPESWGLSIPVPILGGLQLSIFDVSDPSNPVLRHRHTLAGGDATSTAITGDQFIRGDGDHLALGFFPDLGIITIPTQSDYGRWFHPDENQQLEILSFDLEQGIQHLGTIDHETEITRAVLLNGQLVVTSSTKVTTHNPYEPARTVTSTNLRRQDIPRLVDLPINPPIQPPIQPPVQPPFDPPFQPPVRRIVDQPETSEAHANTPPPVTAADKSLLEAEANRQQVLTDLYTVGALPLPSESSEVANTAEEQLFADLYASGALPRQQESSNAAKEASERLIAELYASGALFPIQDSLSESHTSNAEAGLEALSEQPLVKMNDQSEPIVTGEWSFPTLR
jgi:hypothetical protein